MVVEDGAAVEREVKVINRDAERVLIQRGLSDGDIVILSRVVKGEKVIGY
jgi:uncharacterized protein YciW